MFKHRYSKLKYETVIYKICVSFELKIHILFRFVKENLTR